MYKNTMFLLRCHSRPTAARDAPQLLMKKSSYVCTWPSTLETCHIRWHWFTHAANINDETVSIFNIVLFFQQCSLCPEQFLYKKNLSFHMMKIHGFPKPHAVSFWWHADVVMVSIMFLLFLYIKLFFFQSLVSPVPKNILNQNRTVRARSSQTSRWKAVCVRGVWPPGVQPKWPADTH